MKNLLKKLHRDDVLKIRIANEKRDLERRLRAGGMSRHEAVAEVSKCFAKTSGTEWMAKQ